MLGRIMQYSWFVLFKKTFTFHGFQACEALCCFVSVFTVHWLQGAIA